jgi:Protein of unknown function (DUF732)
MPTVMAAKETSDGQFLQLITQADLTFTDPAAAAADGHRVCDVMTAYGYTVNQTVVVEANATPGMDTVEVRSVVIAAVAAYCPQFQNRP